MMNCSAMTVKGVQCKNKAKTNGMCTRHYNIKATVSSDSASHEKEEDAEEESIDDTPLRIPIDAITLTFGDCMENHVGMQKVGEMSTRGFTFEQLNHIRLFFKDLGAVTILHHLNTLLDEEDQKQVGENAYLLIIKNGVNFLDKDNRNLSANLYKEHSVLDYDKSYYDTRRNKVLNKLARWNLCFDDEDQEPDYENKKGTIISYSDVPFTSLLKNKISELIDPNLKLEANYYYDLMKTGIGYHGDGERRKVVGVRIGKDNPFAFKWFKDSEHKGEKFQTILSHGDMYIMSEKAVGIDWKKRSIFTLRHAAGSIKYTA